MIRADMSKEWGKGEHLSRKEMGKVQETPSVAELSRMCKVREGTTHLPGPEESPRVEQLSRKNLPGPSLENMDCQQEVTKLVQIVRQIPRLGETRQVPLEEIPRVEQLSCGANLPGQSLDKNNAEEI